MDIVWRFGQPIRPNETADSIRCLVHFVDDFLAGGPRGTAAFSGGLAYFTPSSADRHHSGSTICPYPCCFVLAGSVVGLSKQPLSRNISVEQEITKETET